MAGCALAIQAVESEIKVLQVDTLKNAWREISAAIDLSSRHAVLVVGALPVLQDGVHRAEAIWRMSKKLDVMELTRVIGHRDLKSLLIYYQTSADELADRLG